MTDIPTDPKGPLELRRAFERVQVAVRNSRTDRDGNVLFEVPESEPDSSKVKDGELALWLDTSGPALRFKVKGRDGTVYTGSLSLA